MEQDTNTENLVKKTDKPWGYEELLLDKDSFGFKRLVLFSGKMSSYHYHNNKNEIFYVDAGSARIRLENEEKTLLKGEYLYLPKGTVHQILNDQQENLVILEFGHPQDDTDVVRVEDPWNRG